MFQVQTDVSGTPHLNTAADENKESLFWNKNVPTEDIYSNFNKHLMQRKTSKGSRTTNVLHTFFFSCFCWVCSFDVWGSCAPVSVLWVVFSDLIVRVEKYTRSGLCWSVLDHCRVLCYHVCRGSFRPVKEELPAVLNNRSNVFDGDEFDVFRREQVDMSRVWKGRR